jgi:hypothetical protein
LKIIKRLFGRVERQNNREKVAIREKLCGSKKKLRLCHIKVNEITAPRKNLLTRPFAKR